MNAPAFLLLEPGAAGAAAAELAIVAQRRPPADDDAPRARRRLSLAAADPLGWLLGPALLLLAWTLGSLAGVIDPRVLP